MNVNINPELVIAIFGGLGTFVTVIWKLARKQERNKNYNGNGDLRDNRDYSKLLSQIKEGLVTKNEHNSYKENRKEVENILFTNQKEMKDNIIRVENSIVKLGYEERKGRSDLYKKLENDRKDILDEIKAINKN
jgi:hypothetical protein